MNIHFILIMVTDGAAEVSYLNNMMKSNSIFFMFPDPRADKHDWRYHTRGQP